MEQFFCLDCRTVNTLNAHGKCSTCDSSSVVTCEQEKNAMARLIFQNTVDREVEKILKRG